MREVFGWIGRWEFVTERGYRACMNRDMGICDLRAKEPPTLKGRRLFCYRNGAEKAGSLFLCFFLMSEQDVYHIINAFPTCGVECVDCGGSRGGVCEQLRLQDIRKQQIG